MNSIKHKLWSNQWIITERVICGELVNARVYYKVDGVIQLAVWRVIGEGLSDIIRNKVG